MRVDLRGNEGMRLCVCYLDVALGDEPGSVCQNLVDVVEVSHPFRGVLQAPQPLHWPSYAVKLLHMHLHQEGALVAGSSLMREKEGSRPDQD